jgi:ribonuclease HI
MHKNTIKKEDILKIYTDGAARGNPGPGACAFIFVKGEEVIYSDSKYLGTVTNNKAEYNAVIEALKKAVEYTRWNVWVYSDSTLIIKVGLIKWSFFRLEEQIDSLQKRIDYVIIIWMRIRSVQSRGRACNGGDY